MTLSSKSVYSSNVLNTSTKSVYIARTSSLVVNVTSSMNSSTVLSTKIVPSSSIQPLPTTKSSMFANHSTLTSTLPIQLSRISTSINSSLAMTTPSSSKKNLSLSSTSRKVVENVNQTTQATPRITRASINATMTASRFSSLVKNSSTIANRTSPTTVIATKAIQPTSVLSSVPATSVANVPVAQSKQRIVSCNLTIINREYTSELSNTSSEKYVQMVNEVKSSV